ncbi:hypothetical protein EMPG_09592 [Blastomyces silverae]|uniref:Uncharacterized protein n=1 Tax=Blastomyces silverae TaxID=2060906 RepID=A0A0H1BKV5_9EURO|nr:hypothetical protein EMPG_09592 [Blastomyces silverae]
MTSHPREPQGVDAQHDRYEYPHEFRYSYDVPMPQTYIPPFEQWQHRYYSIPQPYSLNPLVGFVSTEGVDTNDAQEVTYVGDRFTEQDTIHPRDPNSEHHLPNITFILFGNPFPKCNGMGDMYRPRFQAYPGAAQDVTPELEIGFHHESPRVVHIDIIKSWKGLSSDKAEELLFWETTFKKVLEYLLHDQLELLQQQCEAANRIHRNREHQRGHSDRIHYLPISMIDIATAMFVHTHDCFVGPAVGYGSFPTTGDLRIGVKLLDANDYAQTTATPQLSVYPVEVNWTPDLLSFDQFDPITTEGHEFRLVPRYNPSLSFTGADSYSEPSHIVYTTSATWLRWDPSISGFSGTVPTCSDSEDQMLHSQASLVEDPPGELSKIYTLRIMITATALEYFDTVRFEKTVRSRVMINVKRGKCPQVNPTLDHTLELLGIDKSKCNWNQPWLEWSSPWQPNPQMKWWDDPFIGAGALFGEHAHERGLLQPSGLFNSDESRLLSRHPFDSFTLMPLLGTSLGTDLSTLSDSGQIGQGNDLSPEVPLESGSRVSPPRRRRRSFVRADPVEQDRKLGSTILPQMKTHRPNHPRTESGDKRLHDDIVNMLDMPLHTTQADEELETRYRPCGKRSSWRSTGVSVQKKGNGYPFQDHRPPRNAVLSRTNSEEEDEAYILKYCELMSLASNQPQPSGNSRSPDFNASGASNSESLAIDGSRCLNSYSVMRAEWESNTDVPWTPPASDAFARGFEGYHHPGATNPQAERGSDHGDAESPPLIRGKDKAAFVQMIVERAEEERRMLGSDISDIFASSPPSTSEGEWEDIGTDEEGVSIPDVEHSYAGQTHQGVSIPVHDSPPEASDILIPGGLYGY